MFVWGIEPYNETSHEGMRKVFYKLGQNLQMFKVDEDTFQCRQLPNANKRRIHFCVDQLSARNFRHLTIELTKKLTELSGSKIILPILETLSQFTCTHDHLHEIRMHRNDAIYRTHYGGFLQPFQCHLRQKGITGNVDKNMQKHEKFLMLVDNSHRRLRMKKIPSAN